MRLIRTKTESSPKAAAKTPADPRAKTVVFTGKRMEGTWVMETNLSVPVRRSPLNNGVVVSDNRRVRTLH
jgi:hypothetical protein